MDKKKLSLYLTTPFVLSAPIGIGYFFGAWLDGQLGTKPYCAFIFLFLGCIAGIVEFYRIIKRLKSED